MCFHPLGTFSFSIVHLSDQNSSLLSNPQVIECADQNHSRSPLQLGNNSSPGALIDPGSDNDDTMKRAKLVSLLPSSGLSTNHRKRKASTSSELASESASESSSEEQLPIQLMKMKSLVPRILKGLGSTQIHRVFTTRHLKRHPRV